MDEQRELAPPWVAFPYIPWLSSGWKTGPGSFYWWQWNGWFRALHESARNEYKERFPEPTGWAGFYETTNAGEQSDFPGAADQTRSTNNLKQIALAMLSHHEAFRSFPAAYSTDKDGKPLLSWRVQILPYIEEGPLYKEFHLDEPWESEHNKKLIPRMPKFYVSPGSKAAKEFKTVYLVPRGDDTIFPGAKKIQLQQITDGTSYTIMLVEASDDRAVIWTKPDDYAADPTQPEAGLVGLRRGGFLAAFADGSVHFLKDTIKIETLKALFTRAGGEVIDASEL